MALLYTPYVHILLNGTLWKANKNEFEQMITFPYCSVGGGEHFIKWHFSNGIQESISTSRTTKTD